MSDIVEALHNVSRGDHERGCDGRSYLCSCGYDDANEKAAEQAADTIEALRKQVEELQVIADDRLNDNARLTNEKTDALLSVATARAEAFEQAAQIVEQNMLCGPEGVEVLLPRGNSGNKVGLAYAAAIRKASGKSGG